MYFDKIFFIAAIGNKNENLIISNMGLLFVGKFPTWTYAYLIYFSSSSSKINFVLMLLVICKKTNVLLSNFLIASNICILFSTISSFGNLILFVGKYFLKYSGLTIGEILNILTLNLFFK